MTRMAVNQRIQARRALIVLALLLAAALALQGVASFGSGGSVAFAQDPSPTGTSSGRSIELLNPDDQTSGEISNKSDGVDNAYHLVAWVNAPQAGDVVEFKYVPNDQNVEININCLETATSQARFVSPDTYECRWDLSNVPAGSESGTVRALLYSNGNLAATDEEPATIDRAGQTVEITYPTNGGAMGFYTRADGTSAGTIDFRTSGSTSDTDEGTQDVFAYYSISAPGAEAEFNLCSDGAQATEGGTQDSVRCTLTADNPDTVADEAHRPEQVTAVAVVPRDITEGDSPVPCSDPTIPGACDLPDPDSADAHRALGYAQDPSSVLFQPQTQTATPGSCSQIITATVDDQNGRHIVGANVDVHAQGPSDNLFFDDSGNNSSDHQAPETGHTNEAAVDCEAEGTPKPFSGDQGDHDQIGPNDVKHIESTPEGTDDAGQFKFQLYTTDSGETQFTAWADEDGNDHFCTEEAHGHGSIGWNTGAPSPTGVAAEATSCPTATPTGSPTGSPTASPTASPTGSPTGTATQGPGTARTLTLTTNKNKMPAGRKVTFSGQILSNDQSCTDDEFVQIRRRIHGTTSYKDLFGTQTDNEGRFSVERRARKSADYIAVAPAHDNCAEDTSSEATVLTKVLIQILPSDKNPDRGDWIRIKSSVRPQHDQTRLILQRRKGNGWVRVAATKMNNRSIGNFWMRARWNSRTFRTRWPKQHEDHEANRSRGVTIRTR